MSSSEHYVWAVDGKPISVHLAASVVRQLEAHLPANTSGREAEIGGLLLGRARQVNDSWIVAVEEIEYVACEHARGPSWTLSRLDRDALARQLRRSSKRGVVGWFRTHTRPGLYLDEHDFRLFRDLFHHPAAVALAVRDDGQAGFFFWENHDIVRNRPYVTFTCRAEALRFAPEPIKDVVLPLRPPAAPSRFRKELLWVPLAAAVALAAFWTPPLPFDEESERTRQVAAAERPVFSPPPDVQPAELKQTATVTPPPPAVHRPSAIPRARLEASEIVEPRKVVKPRPAKAVVATAEPPKAHVLKRAVGSIPGLGFLKKNKQDKLDAPPVVTRRVAPAPFRETYPVRVKVKIGTDGYVKGAYLLTNSASAETVQAVMRAARSWRFTPARQENKPVESELILTFEPHSSGT